MLITANIATAEKHRRRRGAFRDPSSDAYLLTKTFLFINKKLHRKVHEEFGDWFSGRVVDIGCGLSPYKKLFTNVSEYVGLDLAAERRPSIISDVHALPLKTGIAQGALCFEVLEHAVDPDRVVAEINRILTRGSLLAVTAPMSWNVHYAPHDYRRYTCFGLWQLLRRHGFEPIETRRIGGLFSLIGSRLVDGISVELWRRLRFIPPRLRHALILIYSIPTSLIFYVLAKIADDFEATDAIAWAVVARKE